MAPRIFDRTIFKRLWHTRYEYSRTSLFFLQPQYFLVVDVTSKLCIKQGFLFLLTIVLRALIVYILRGALLDQCLFFIHWNKFLVDGKTLGIKKAFKNSERSLRRLPASQMPILRKGDPRMPLRSLHLLSPDHPPMCKQRHSNAARRFLVSNEEFRFVVHCEKMSVGKGRRGYG